jgi:hypothetical protein
MTQGTKVGTSCWRMVVTAIASMNQSGVFFKTLFQGRLFPAGVTHPKRWTTSIGS